MKFCPTFLQYLNKRVNFTVIKQQFLICIEYSTQIFLLNAKCFLSRSMVNYRYFLSQGEVSLSFTLGVSLSHRKNSPIVLVNTSVN